MKLLANARISRVMLAHLESLGHDCLHVEMLSPGLSDETIVQLAMEQKRVILTADKDFGELVFRRHLPAIGVVLVRLRAASERERLALFQQHWPMIEERVVGHFVVATNRRIRRRLLAMP